MNETKPVRLTNKTAIALRHSGVRVKRACFAVGLVVSLALSALAVWFGIRWLPAVPIFVAVLVAVDVLLYIHADRISLETMAQALCMEEAIRTLRESDSRMERRRQAEEDRREAMADALSASGPVVSFAGKAAERAAMQQKAAPAEQPAGEEPHRRRRGQTGPEERQA